MPSTLNPAAAGPSLAPMRPSLSTRRTWTRKPDTQGDPTHPRFPHPPFALRPGPVQLGPPSPYYVPRNRTAPIDRNLQTQQSTRPLSVHVEEQKPVLCSGNRTAPIDRSLQTQQSTRSAGVQVEEKKPVLCSQGVQVEEKKPVQYSQGVQAESMRMTNTLQGCTFGLVPGTFRRADMQLAVTFIQVHGGRVRTVEDGPPPAGTCYILIPTAVQTEPEGMQAVIGVLTQEHAGWRGCQAVTCDWIADCVNAEGARPNDPPALEHSDILEELCVLEEEGLTTADERSEDEAERRLLVSQGLLVRVIRAMLPDTPMWRAMEQAPDVKALSKDEVVAQAQAAMVWEAPPRPVKQLEAPDEEDSRMDVEEPDMGDGSVAETKASATSRTFVIPAQRFAQAEGDGTPQRPIIIDDSD